MKHRIPSPIPVDLSVGGAVPPIPIIVMACATLTKETKPRAALVDTVKPRAALSQRGCP